MNAKQVFSRMLLYMCHKKTGYTNESEAGIFYLGYWMDNS